MTALNGFTQPGAAYLLTDGAEYSRTGTVQRIAPKVVRFDSLKMAVGWAGRAGGKARHLWDLQHSPPKTQIEGLLAIAEAARAMVACNPVEYRELRFQIAVWNETTNGSQLWAVDSGQLQFGPGYEPFKPVRLKVGIDMQLDELRTIFGDGFSMDSFRRPDQFNPRIGGLTLLQALREKPWPDGKFYVGGFGQLTTVSAAGIATERLIEWPDRVGRPVTPQSGGRTKSMSHH